MAISANGTNGWTYSLYGSLKIARAGVTDFYLGGWVKRHAAQSNRSLFFTGDSVGGQNFAVIYGWVANQIEFQAVQYTGSNPKTGTGITIADEQWHHIAYQRIGTGWYKWLDGVRTTISANISFSLLDNTGTLVSLMGLSELYPYCFNGAIEDWAAVAGVVSDEQIIALANGRRFEEIQANYSRGHYWPLSQPHDCFDLIGDYHLREYLGPGGGTNALIYHEPPPRLGPRRRIMRTLRPLIPANLVIGFCSALAWHSSEVTGGGLAALPATAGAIQGESASQAAGTVSLACEASAGLLLTSQGGGLAVASSLVAAGSGGASGLGSGSILCSAAAGSAGHAGPTAAGALACSSLYVSGETSATSTTGGAHLEAQALSGQSFLAAGSTAAAEIALHGLTADAAGEALLVGGALVTTALGPAQLVALATGAASGSVEAAWLCSFVGGQTLGAAAGSLAAAWQAACSLHQVGSGGVGLFYCSAIRSRPLWSAAPRLRPSHTARPSLRPSHSAVARIHRC